MNLFFSICKIKESTNHVACHKALSLARMLLDLHSILILTIEFI